MFKPVSRDHANGEQLPLSLTNCMRTVCGIFFFLALMGAWWQLTHPLLLEQWILDRLPDWSLRPSLSSAGGDPNALPLPVAASFPLSLKTGLLILHLAGLVLGFGSALFLDMYLMRFLFLRPIQPNTHEIVHLGSTLVSIGLLVLWISGFGFLLLYWHGDPMKLDNPKIWSKLVMVALLSVNGLVVHASLLSKIKSKTGQFLLDGECRKTRRLFALVASISSVSWIGAMVLGVAKELNHNVDGGTVLTLYVGAIALAYGAFTLLFRIRPQPRKVARPAISPMQLFSR